MTATVCNNCRFVRNCINGKFCTIRKSYIEHNIVIFCIWKMFKHKPLEKGIAP